MIRGLFLSALCAVGILLTACSTDPLVTLELRRYPPSMWLQTSKPNGLLVSVEPFVDARDHDRFLGRSRPLGGSETIYGYTGGDLGEVIAQMLATYLAREQGWQAWFGKTSAGQPEDGPDVVLSGRILECRLDVRDWGLVWLVTARAELTVEIKNKSATETERDQIILTGTASDWFLRYGPSRLGSPLTDVLLQTFRELVGGIVVEGTMLRKAPSPSSS